MNAPRYQIRRATPPVLLDWTGPGWCDASWGEVAEVRPEGGAHVPYTRFRMLADKTALYIQFRVEDCFVRSVCTEFQGAVCRDSCVEFFVAPIRDAGYFNFEVNASGVLHLWHIRDARRVGDGFADGRPISVSAIAQIDIQSTFSGVVDPEITVPTTWGIGIRVPFAFFEAELQRVVKPRDTWRANFYKLGSGTSHPHWISWAPIGRELNFHCPKWFGFLDF